ncbi:hypothetical protein ACFYUV_49975 [Nonomuraea sp. NPDC003560]|uniref:hypothetical protein n=1 Tax=Nonomuraea sp. NPDC003560 TaxID=3364341 RepID=UPI0036C7AC66
MNVTAPTSTRRLAAVILAAAALTSGALVAPAPATADTPYPEPLYTWATMRCRNAGGLPAIFGDTMRCEGGTYNGWSVNLRPTTVTRSDCQLAGGAPALVPRRPANRREYYCNNPYKPYHGLRING